MTHFECDMTTTDRFLELSYSRYLIYGIALPVSGID
jgi:hypothetical protein